MGNAGDGIVRSARILAAVLVAGTLCAPASGFAAPDKKGAKPAADAPPQKDAASAERAYAAGTKAYEAGNMNEAAQQLSAALAGGGLPNPQMAKALYYRGTAYRKQGKPAQAISDLTTAVWLKGGLSDADRTKATEERQLAYQEAGLGSSAPPIGAAPLDAPAAKPVQQAQAPAPAGTAPVPPPAAPRPGVLVATVPPKSGFFSVPSISMPKISMPTILGGGSSSTATPAPTPAPAAAAPQPAAVAPAQAAAAPAAPVPHQSSASWETTAAAAPQASIPAAGFAPETTVTTAAAEPTAATLVSPAQTTETTPAPASTVAGTISGAGSAISGFFGGMFGSGSGASAQATAPSSALATGSTGPAHGDAPWDGATVVAQTSSMVQRGPEEPPAPLPWAAGQTVAAAQPVTAEAPPTAARAAAAGKFKLQVAAVRTRQEAEKLAATLTGYQAVQTGAVQPEIDEAVIGSMGTFYRVRLGPYADAKEPGQLCKTLKPQGFDCMVVTQ